MGVPFCTPSLASQCSTFSVCHALASYSIGFLAKRNGGAFIVNHCIIDNPRAINAPHHQRPARHRRAASSAARAPTKAAAPFRFYPFLSHFTRKTRLQYNNYLLIFNNKNYKLLIINIQNIYTFLDNYMKFIYLCRVKSRPTSESRSPLIY